MELSSIQHIDPGKLADFQPDLFIVSLSHETRSTNIAKSLEGISCRKVALCEPDQVKEYNYLANQEYLQDKGFEILELDNGDRDLDYIFKWSAPDDLKILLDCTSMTQLLYHRILNWFTENHQQNSVQLRLGYTMAAYVNEGSALHHVHLHLQVLSDLHRQFLFLNQLKSGTHRKSYQDPSC